MLSGRQQRNIAKTMKVVLKEDMEGRGLKGEIIDVRRGFARNHLFPKKLAVYATSENVKLYDPFRKKINTENREKLDQQLKARKKVAKLTVEMFRWVLETKPSVRLHSPVHIENIAEKLWKQHKVRLAPEQILLPAPITSLGTYKIAVRLDDDDDAEPTFLRLTLKPQNKTVLDTVFIPS